MVNKDKTEARKKLDELGIEEVITTIVKPFGTSAYINISKKYIGKKVTIIIPKE